MDFLYGAHAPYHAFFERFQRAVAVGNKSAVADMVLYPITLAGLNGEKLVLDSRKAFITHYDTIFTPKRIAIVEHQTYATLLPRDEGVMMGQSGEIWFSGICRDSRCKVIKIKIIALNPSD